MFAVPGVQLASTTAAAVAGLGRAASTASRRAVTPQVGSAVDAWNVEKSDAFK